MTTYNLTSVLSLPRTPRTSFMISVSRVAGGVLQAQKGLSCVEVSDTVVKRKVVATAFKGD